MKILHKLQSEGSFLKLSIFDIQYIYYADFILKMELDAKVRSECGTKKIKKLRKNGKVPGIIYGPDFQSQMITINEKELIKHSSVSSFFNTILTLNISKTKEKVLPKDISYDPVTGSILHIDFLHVNKGTKIKIQIPIETINEDKSPGIKKGGIVNLVVHKLECLVSPEEIPEKIELDLTGKEIGDNFLLDQINLPNGVKPVNASRDAVLATIVVSTIGKEESAISETTENQSESVESTEKK